MPQFSFQRTAPINLKSNRNLDEARTAISEQLQLIEEGRTTARQSMHYLLKTFPVLKRDKRGGSHVLSALVEHYVAEHLSA